MFPALPTEAASALRDSSAITQPRRWRLIMICRAVSPSLFFTSGLQPKSSSLYKVYKDKNKAQQLVQSLQVQKTSIVSAHSIY